jgi:hypothetical protein
MLLMSRLCLIINSKFEPIRKLNASQKAIYLAAVFMAGIPVEFLSSHGNAGKLPFSAGRFADEDEGVGT